MMLRSMVVALVAAMLAFGLWYAAGSWHPSDRRYPRQGIDVSHHQGRIDWTRLRAQGVDFAYIKASEGGDWRDPAYTLNAHGARAAGIPQGAYHFFTLCRPGATQAANFLAATDAAERLPPAVDLEDLSHCTAGVSKDRFHHELATFMALVEARRHRRVILYLTAEFDRRFDVSERVDRPLWLRSIGRSPQFGERPWVIWQASNLRQLDGIEQRVDWNAAR